MTEITTNLTERQKYAARIRETMSSTVQAIIQTGRILEEAKAKLKHGEWKALVENDLPFTRQTAFRLMAITHDQRLSDVTHVQHLPPHWGTLYQLSQLHDDEFERGIEQGIIKPDMKRSEVKLLHATPGHMDGAGTVEPPESDDDPELKAIHELRRLSGGIDEPRLDLLRSLNGMREQCSILAQGEAKGAVYGFIKQIDNAIHYVNSASIGQLVIDAERTCRAAWEKIS